MFTLERLGTWLYLHFTEYLGHAGSPKEFGFRKKWERLVGKSPVAMFISDVLLLFKTGHISVFLGAFTQYHFKV